MGNIIAIVWDFDKTLINGYMEDPIFREYNVNPKKFWEETNELPQKYLKEQKVKVNPDTIYLNQMIAYTKKGIFKGLNNEKLRSYGQQLNFYKGVPEIFEKINTAVAEMPLCAEYGVKTEHYIVSTGLKEIIMGSPVKRYMSGIWGCEFIEGENEDGERIISEIGYTMDNTAKTRALFEINKGSGIDEGVEANTHLPEEMRRVHFINMVYVADGPSDIPAFSVIKSRGGSTFAVYPRGDMKAMKQVEQLRKDGRVDMFAEADFSEGSTACMWLCNKAREFAETIKIQEKAKLVKFTSQPLPNHLM